ncbi:hypothetical protein [Falsiroseomonas sp. HW251]|uniref:hypothetical protein n=1 Tax=Falsiroseomonas sp. HW251 TaxID=3390998 RepID=UPI003D321912
MLPALAVPALTIVEAPPGLPPAYRLAEDSGPVVLIAELDAYRPGSTATILGEAALVLPALALTTTPVTLDDYATIRASDAGYVTRNTDPAGVQAYPPILSSGLEIDRQMDLTPNGAGAAAGWGSIRLADDGSLAALVAARNIDARPIRIRLGRKQLLPHGYWRDPAWTETAELVVGLGAAWRLTEREMTVAFRDPGYWLDHPVDGSAYAGTGGLESSAALAGKRKPKLRGGTAGNPVREILAVLVNETSGIYQVSDATGGIVALYERGLSGGITLNANVADITASAPPAGTYNVESSARGLFVRLGTFPPAGLITVDAWGAFPDGTAPSTAAAVALQWLRQDLGMPEALIDAGSFTGLAAACAWTAGDWLFDQPVTGRELVGRLLRSSAARLVPRRTGRLAAVALTALPAGTVPVATYTTAQIVACTPRDPGPPLAPPPYRVRVGVQRYHQTQNSDLAPTLSGTRRQNLAEAYRVRSAAGAGILTAWRRPSDPALVETSLTSTADGDNLAAALRDLWSIAAGRRLWDVTLPLPYALRHDIGEPIVIAYPGPLVAGALGRIVGEQIRTADALATLQVLV